MIKVIIVITSHNQKEYIEDTVKSVLRQNATFDYKILIGDDASTDGTSEIIRKYADLYPDKIEAVFSENNLGSLKNSNRLFDKLQCEYFSFLDGDDLWIGEDRLQKQVDFLDSHKEYMICAGNTRYIRNDVPAEFLLNRKDLDKSYSFDDMIHGRMPFFHTSSMLCRNTIFIKGLPDCYTSSVGTYRECAFRGEDFRRIIHLEQGPLYAFDEVFSMYRIHSKGMWQGSTDLHRLIENMISDYAYYVQYDERFEGYFKKQARFSFERGMMRIFATRSLRNNVIASAKDKKLLLDYLSDYQIAGNNAQPRHEWISGILIKILMKISWTE